MLITQAQTKLQKSVPYGYLTAGLNLAPAHELGLHDPRFLTRTVCAFAGACATTCLSHSGRNAMPDGLKARLWRTTAFYTDRPAFLAQLTREVAAFARKARRLGLTPAFRPNLLSDLPLLAAHLATTVPDVQLYDYTKLPPSSWADIPRYHRTYSYSERTTPDDLRAAVARGASIAVILDIPAHTHGPMPDTLTLHSVTLPVLDGDTHDLRFLDPATPHYIGLRYKAATLAGRRRLAAAVASGLAVPAHRTV